MAADEQKCLQDVVFVSVSHAQLRTSRDFALIPPLLSNFSQFVRTSKKLHRFYRPPGGHTTVQNAGWRLHRKGPVIVADDMLAPSQDSHCAADLA
jgi:hypothetical protein